jgi:hypothetical protein
MAERLRWGFPPPLTPPHKGEGNKHALACARMRCRVALSPEDPADIACVDTGVDPDLRRDDVSCVDAARTTPKDGTRHIHGDVRNALRSGADGKFDHPCNLRLSPRGEADARAHARAAGEGASPTRGGT